MITLLKSENHKDTKPAVILFKGLVHPKMKICH